MYLQGSTSQDLQLNVNKHHASLCGGVQCVQHFPNIFDLCAICHGTSLRTNVPRETLGNIISEEQYVNKRGEGSFDMKEDEILDFRIEP